MSLAVSAPRPASSPAIRAESPIPVAAATADGDGSEGCENIQR